VAARSVGRGDETATLGDLLRDWRRHVSQLDLALDASLYIGNVMLLLLNLPMMRTWVKGD
jgi:hypothetical protein